MRIKYFLIIFTTFLLYFSDSAFSQTIPLSQLKEIKVSQLSDSQITEAWKKIQELGISDQEAYKILEQKGMDPLEVDLFKQRVSMLGLSTSGEKKSTSP